MNQLILFSMMAFQPPAPQTPAALPSQIVLASASYTNKSGAKWAGTGSFAARLSTSSCYNYDSYDLQPVKVAGKLTFASSMRGGGACVMPQVSHGNFYVLVLGTAGVTIVNAAATASGSFGGLAAYRIHGGPFGVWADFQNSNTTGKTARAGVLFSWGEK